MSFQQAFDPIRALGSAWKLIQRHPASLLIGGLLLWLAWLSSGGVPSFGEKFDVKDVEDGREVIDELIQAFVHGWAGLLAAVSCTTALAAWLFRCLMLIGMARAVSRALVGADDDASKLFDARGRYATMVLTTLLKAVIQAAVILPGIALGLGVGFAVGALSHEEAAGVVVGLSVVVLYLPVAIYFWLGISLAEYAVAIEGMGVTEALSRSWSIARGHRLQLLVYWIVMSVIDHISCCACCLLSAPYTWTSVAINESYWRFVRSGEPETWPKE